MPMAAPISVSHASESSPTSSTQVKGTGSTSSQLVIAPTKYRRITPIRRLTIARMISAVTANFGTAESRRSMRDAIPATDGARGRRLGAEDLAPAPLLTLSLEAFDLVPQCAVLALVSRPYLLLRNFPEFVDLGFHHGHAERLQLGLGFGEIVDRLGRLADLL